MKKCLFQGAAPTFEDAIRAWKMNGDESIRAVIRDINGLLSVHGSPNELDEFIDRNSDYGEKAGGRATLEFIKGVLSDGLRNENTAIDL
jgi:hypothetical protein